MLVRALKLKESINKRIIVNNRDRICIIAVIALLLTILPTTRLGLIIRALLISATVLYVFVYKNYRLKLSMRTSAVIGIAVLNYGISVGYSFTQWSTVNSSLIIHEGLRLAVNVALIVIIPQLKCNFRSLYYICTIIVIINVAIGIWQWFFPAESTSWIMKYYVDGSDIPIHLKLPSLSQGYGKRSTSYFINPNVFSLVLIICLPVILEGFRRKKGIIESVTLVLLTIGVILAGSRTGIIIYLAIVLAFMFKNHFGNAKKVIAAFFSMLITAIFLLLLLKYVGPSDYRAFSIADGLSGSFGAKFDIIVNYLDNNSIITVLLGGIGNPHYQMMDSEWGYVISMYGLIGLIWYMGLYTLIFKQNSRPKFIKYCYIAILALAACTETVFYCLPVSALFFLLTMSRCSDWI